MNQPAYTIKGYLDDLVSLINAVDTNAIDHVVEVLFNAWKKGNRVLLMGNGGSSSTASHIVADLQKNIQIESGKALKTICLTDSTPLITAWSNDSHYENVFAPQVECWAEPGDVVIGVSGSGNSMNVINGIAAGNKSGAYTIGLAGYKGGKLKDTAQYCIVVESDNMQRIEDIHIILLHAIYLGLIGKIQSDQASS